ncbi:hypothetical protein IT774_15135 [Salinimonas marina]|uniref:Lipoprotein n=1 Tax=Salinimonas marina TaxID=2785918 RepID=A0A7S9DWU1_9ALTE|nr:hypothetical protein [Salinimonas marina]QPG05413.1 hypothetical protein IT774_15135 [Salinimonas marina]
MKQHPLVWLCSLLALLIISGCSYVKQPNDKKMKKLLSGMPEYYANEAFGKRDFRFFVVRDGNSTTTPSVPACLVTRFGTREMSNDSYEAGTYAYEKYAAVAKVYARFFNQTLLEQLKQRDWHHCEAQVPAPAVE